MPQADRAEANTAGGMSTRAAQPMAIRARVDGSNVRITAQTDC